MKKILIVSFLVFSVGAAAQVTSRLEGRIKNRPYSTTIYLGTRNTDWRTQEFIKIPVVDSAFSYTLTVDYPQLYVLVFEDEVRKGAWYPVEFMTENGVIDFELNPMDDYRLNVIRGGTLNTRFRYLKKKPDEIYPTDPVYARCDSLQHAGTYYSEAMKRWITEIERAEKGSTRDSLFKVRDSIDEYVPEVKALYREIDSLQKLQVGWTMKEIGRSVDESGLAVLGDFVYRAVNYSDKAVNLSDCEELYEKKYRKKYAGNPMAREIDLLLASTDVKVGGRYVDFTASDLTGTDRRLSALIDGKVAVIDLWASWCGPCMRTSKSFVPLWEKYRDTGFTIVGIAREKNDTRAMEEAIERLGLPWLNLVELNDNDKIWMKYGADNKAGRVILVDSGGKIVAVDFDAAELEKHLQRLCGSKGR